MLGLAFAVTVLQDYERCQMGSIRLAIASRSGTIARAMTLERTAVGVAILRQSERLCFRGVVAHLLP